MTTEVKKVIETHKFIVIQVSANMAKYYQLLELTFNNYAKTFR